MVKEIINLALKQRKIFISGSVWGNNNMVSPPKNTQPFRGIKRKTEISNLFYRVDRPGSLIRLLLVAGRW